MTSVHTAATDIQPPVQVIDSEGQPIMVAAPRMCGAAGLKKITVKGLKTGTCKFQMTFVRKWEWNGKFDGENGAQLVSFNVEVK